MSDDRYIVVTTDKRGVFFGASDPEIGQDPIILHDAQMCVYWSEEVRGVLGLAATGPTAKCRVTQPVQRMELRGITSVMECTPEAVGAWRAVPWAQ